MRELFMLMGHAAECNKIQCPFVKSIRKTTGELLDHTAEDTSVLTTVMNTFNVKNTWL